MSKSDNNWQFVSLELAKELKEAGYPQEGLWWCIIWENGAEQIFTEKEYKKEKHHFRFKEGFVCPTVAELGEGLSNQTKYAFATYKSCGKWFCFDINKRDFYKEANTEANARASMWLYLKKEKLL